MVSSVLSELGMRKYISALVVVSVLVGCASMTPEECLHADWREVGYNDALRGCPVSRLADHREACAEAAVTVDFDSYTQGYALGLPLYCTRETGFESADHGGAYAAQCGRETFPLYALGYSQGSEVFSLKKESREFEREIDDKTRQHEALMDQLGELRRDRDDPNLSRDDVKDISYRIDQLEAVARKLGWEIESLEQEQERREDAIDQLVSAFYGSLP